MEMFKTNMDQTKYFVYIIRSVKFHKYYIEETSNLKRRLKEHNKGQTKSTFPYRPYVYYWVTQKPSKNNALELERKLKNLKSRKKLEAFAMKYPSLDIEKIISKI